MGVSHLSGPILTGPSGSGNIQTLPLAPDRGPSTLFGGTMLQDPRLPYQSGGGTENNALLSVAAGINGGYLVLDQAPSTAVVNNLAVAAATTSGTAMALVSSSGAGITVTTSATFIPQTGNTVISGAKAIDLTPGLVFFGTNKSTSVADPTKNLSRAITITASSGAVGGAFLVAGADLYGYPQTEKITVASSPSGATTTTGKKAFKFITAVTPQVTDTKSYSVGTADVFGFPLQVNSFPYATVGWAGALIASSTGFVAAVTSTATNTTGDARGTYAVQSASNGVITLQMFLSVSPANISTIAGIFGVTPA